MALSGEALDKFNSMKALAESAYRDATVLEDAVTLEDYNSRIHHREFYQLPYRRIMEREWFTDPTYVMDLVFGEIGRGIAFSEQRVLVEELGRIATSEPIAKPLVGVLTKISELIQDGFQPTLLFVPIEHYMEAYTTWLGPQLRIASAEGHPFLEMGQQARLRVVWSSKLIPFNDFFIVNRSWAKWIVKKRFAIETGAQGDLDMIFRTVYRLEVLEGPRAVRRISSTTTR